MNYKSKKELYEESKEKNRLLKADKDNYKYSEYRHTKNSEYWKGFKTFIKIIFFPVSIPVYFYKNRKSLKIANEKELLRLKLVMESKERARIKMLLDEKVPWYNKYLSQDGIFKIGIALETNETMELNFNKFANLLIGGLPGGGKSVLIQLIAFQCLKYSAKVHLADFKGGLSTQKFENKCNVVTEHTKLYELLIYFKKEIERRIKLFRSVGVEKLAEYNEITGNNLKREYLIIDELGEAMEIDVDGITEKEEKKLKSDIEKLLRKLARLGRALGLNIIAGTQRPDVGILEGQTRSMFGCRVCFQADKATSLIVLDDKRADELDETPGRAIVKKRKNYTTIQCFYFNTESLKEIKNKKLDKKDLKIINSKEENRETDEIIDIDID
ncbi:MAG: FtsK/SpoIIIE domain-containing protein [Clostridiales bacterium]